jgi:hypothetical protein
MRVFPQGLVPLSSSHQSHQRSCCISVRACLHGLALLPYSALICLLPLAVSFLDVPDLSTLSSTCRYLASLAADPILQRTRLLVVAPSRLSHSLFAIGPEGSPLRPTISDLIRRGVMKGFDIERRWRAGLYLYSASARAASSFMQHSVLTGTLHSL